VTTRGELARTLLDLTAVSPARRLGAIRELLPRALEAMRSLDAPVAVGPIADRPVGRGRRSARAELDPPGSDVAQDGDEPGTATAARIPAAERRRAAMFILEVWRDLTRDLLLAGLGELAAVHDPALIDDLLTVAPALPAGEMRAFLGRLAKAGELLEANVGAELALDSLILAWPRAAA